MRQLAIIEIHGLRPIFDATPLAIEGKCTIDPHGFRGNDTKRAQLIEEHRIGRLGPDDKRMGIRRFDALDRPDVAHERRLRDTQNIGNSTDRVYEIVRGKRRAIVEFDTLA